MLCFNTGIAMFHKTASKIHCPKTILPAYLLIHYGSGLGRGNKENVWPNCNYFKAHFINHYLQYSTDYHRRPREGWQRKKQRGSGRPRHSPCCNTDLL